MSLWWLDTFPLKPMYLPSKKLWPPYPQIYFTVPPSPPTCSDITSTALPPVNCTLQTGHCNLWTAHITIYCRLQTGHCILWNVHSKLQTATAQCTLQTDIYEYLILSISLSSPSLPLPISLPLTPTLPFPWGYGRILGEEWESPTRRILVEFQKSIGKFLGKYWECIESINRYLSVREEYLERIRRVVLEYWVSRKSNGRVLIESWRWLYCLWVNFAIQLGPAANV